MSCRCAAAAALPPGPRLAFVRFGPNVGTELFTSDPGGGERLTVFGSDGGRFPFVTPFGSAAWAPDGQQIAFPVVVGVREARSFGHPETAIATVAADGGAPEVLAGTEGGASPVYSSDGERLAYTRRRIRYRPIGREGVERAFDSSSVWLADLGTGERRRLTPWRNGLHAFPSSFSPDGGLLAVTIDPPAGPPRAVVISLVSGARTVLAENALEPVFSPDGSRLAFLRGPRRVTTRRADRTSPRNVWREAAIFTAAASGAAPRLVKRTPHATEVYPRWDPSGQRHLDDRAGRTREDDPIVEP
mgnify:CR=1 FL=1